MQDELNKHDIFLLDVFYLNYYGINVFFQVCQTQEDKVCVYELATKTRKIKGKKVDTLTNRLKPSKNPLFVPKYMNTYTKSEYWVPSYILEDRNSAIMLSIGLFDPIYNEAVRRGTNYPSFGFVYPHKVTDYINKYWERKEEDEGFGFSLYID